MISIREQGRTLDVKQEYPFENKQKDMIPHYGGNGKAKS